MRKVWLIIFLPLMLVLAACQNATPEQTAPTETAIPTVEATAQPMAVSEDYCLDCHTDKEQLISTAKLEEVVEEESKGVG
jgi:hypothetical protein